VELEVVAEVVAVGGCAAALADTDFLRLSDKQHVLVIVHTAWTSDQRPVDVTIHVLPRISGSSTTTSSKRVAAAFTHRQR
jgi:hypothetical protein